MISNFKFTYLLESVYVLSLTSPGLFYSFTIPYNLSIYTFFDTEIMYLQILVNCKVLVNLSATTDFPSLCIECISILLSFNHFLQELL